MAFKRKRSGSTWGAKKRRTTKRVPRKNLTTLTKQVKSLRKAVSTSTDQIKYQQILTNQVLATVGGGTTYTAYPLTYFNNWGRIFGGDADDEAHKSALIRNMWFRFRVESNETDMRSYSFFIVRPKAIGSDIALGTSMGTLSNNVHFILPPSSAGDVLLNKKYFTVLYSKKFTFGMPPTYRELNATYSVPAVQSVPTVQHDLFRSFGKNINFGKAGLRVHNPSGDWRAGGYPKSVTNQVYLMVFYSDSTADGQTAVMHMQNMISVSV